MIQVKLPGRVSLVLWPSTAGVSLSSRGPARGPGRLFTLESVSYTVTSRNQA